MPASVVNPNPGLLKRLVCFFLNVCPRCEQSMRVGGTQQFYYFCQTPDCLKALEKPPYVGPERRRAS